MVDILALMIPIVFILAMASVLILRPITKRLGDTLNQIQEDRHGARLDQSQVDQLRGMIESVHERLELVEQRQGFLESLLESRSGQTQLRAGGDPVIDRFRS